MTDKETKDYCKNCDVEPPAMRFKCPECEHNPDKEQIMIDGIAVRNCNFFLSSNKYCGLYSTGCRFVPNCHFKQLARKTQECEELKEKLYQIEDVVKPINEQLPEDNVIRQIMLILNDCNGLQPSRYRKALEEIENFTKKHCDYWCEHHRILDIIHKAKGTGNGLS